MRGSPKIIDILSNILLFSYEVIYKENDDLDSVLLEIRSVMGEGLKDYERKIELFIKLADRFLVAGVELILIFMGYIVDHDKMKNITQDAMRWIEIMTKEVPKFKAIDTMKWAEIGLYEGVKEGINRNILFYGYPDQFRPFDLIMTPELEYTYEGVTMGTQMYEATNDLLAEIYQKTDDLKAVS